ncbi:unnamed protein product, partial [Callosobruchus maculatus]
MQDVDNMLKTLFLKRTFDTTGYATLNFIISFNRGSLLNKLYTTIVPVAKCQDKSDVSTYWLINTLVDKNEFVVVIC